MNPDNILIDATDIAAFMKSPRMFWWNRLYNGTGIVLAKPNIHFAFGGLWSEFVASFYAGLSKADALNQTMEKWAALSEDFTPKEYEPLSKALPVLIGEYYLNFRPDDGIRTESEVEFVWNGFCGRVDGEQAGIDYRMGHECKATSRAYSLADQVWYYQNSIQIKLYAIARNWDSVVIELAYKDAPYKVFRAPAMQITPDIRADWTAELTLIRLAMLNCIRENRFLCVPQGCNIVGKKGSWLCDYKPLCDGKMDYLDQFKPRKEHLSCRVE
jgi:hypothetical protein